MKFVIPLIALLSMVFMSCEKQDSDLSSRDVTDEFPNKTLTFWKTKEIYVLHLYGELAYISRKDANAPKYLYPIGPERFMSLWTSFKNLPRLDDHKNHDPNTLKSRSSHTVVFLNDVAGINIGLGLDSYSIPEDISELAYVSWRKSLREVVTDYMSETVRGKPLPAT